MSGAHTDLHAERGALRGEHAGRSRDPVIRIADIAWLEFDKPDLVRAEAFARAFWMNNLNNVFIGFGVFICLTRMTTHGHQHRKI